MPSQRVQKIMAQADIGSRRSCEEIIRQGRVQVNGAIVSLGAKADPARDVIMVDGARIAVAAQALTIALNKPKGVLSTTKAEAGDERPTIRELVDVPGHLFTIGRLDVDSEGLMILTNDGELANRITHPRYEHTKTYKVTVKGKPTRATLEKWQAGIWLDDSRTAACSVKVLQSTKRSTVLRVVMVEGRKRQIRRVAGALGHPVIRIVRTHIGQLGLGTLRKGAWYQLADDEIDYMLQPAPALADIRRKRRARKRNTRQ
ncbi:MAG: pseudouridine synthase [Chloroflexi bacterium]|nr:pseudouridine synthase [Chloroflexota bacterium]MDE2650293.1 pseudouridine synthase [Chloroflexota bacterium]